MLTKLYRQKKKQYSEKIRLGCSDDEYRRIYKKIIFFLPSNDISCFHRAIYKQNSTPYIKLLANNAPAQNGESTRGTVGGFEIVSAEITLLYRSRNRNRKCNTQAISFEMESLRINHGLLIFGQKKILKNNYTVIDAIMERTMVNSNGRHRLKRKKDCACILIIQNTFSSCAKQQTVPFIRSNVRFSYSIVRRNLILPEALIKVQNRRL